MPEEKENPGGQPEPELNEKQKRFQQFKAKMDEVGLDMNLMFDIFSGISENDGNKREARLASLIQTKVDVLGSSLSKQIEDRQKGLEGQMNQVIEALKAGPAQSSMSVIPAGELPPGPGVMQPQGGGGNALAQIGNFMPILKMLGLVPGGGEVAGGTGGFDQMITYANKIAEFNRAIQAPQLEALTTMRQSVLQDLTALSKTGGTLPWEREDIPVRNSIQTPQKAQFNQPKPDYHEIAIQLSKGMRIVP